MILKYLGSPNLTKEKQTDLKYLKVIFWRISCLYFFEEMFVHENRYVHTYLGLFVRCVSILFCSMIIFRRLGIFRIFLRSVIFGDFKRLKISRRLRYLRYFSKIWGLGDFWLFREIRFFLLFKMFWDNLDIWKTWEVLEI